MLLRKYFPEILHLGDSYVLFVIYFSSLKLQSNNVLKLALKVGIEARRDSHPFSRVYRHILYTVILYLFYVQ